MGNEFVYQTEYGSTIDTLAMRSNIKRFLQNSAFKRSLARDSYQPSGLIEKKIPENPLPIPRENELQLNETLTFLQSESALKLLNLTKRTEAINDSLIDDFTVDESKKNIFAA